MVLAKNINWRLVRLIIVAAVLGQIVAVYQSKPATALTVKQNQTLGYPHSQMPCEHYPYNIGGSCTNFDWGPQHTEFFDHPSQYSSRGYTYRNCTDYAAWKLSTKGINVPHNLGNAADWYGHVPAKQRLQRAKAGSVAVRSGGFGHVAFVESVTSTSSNPVNDVITISEYNYYGLGTGSIRIGTVGELGFTAFIDFGIRSAAKPASTPKPKPVVKVAVKQQPAKPLPSAAKPTTLVPVPVLPNPSSHESTDDTNKSPVVAAPTTSELKTPAANPSVSTSEITKPGQLNPTVKVRSAGCHMHARRHKKDNHHRRHCHRHRHSHKHKYRTRQHKLNES